MPQKSNYGDVTRFKQRGPAADQEVDFSSIEESPTFLEEEANKHPASLDDDGDDFREKSEEETEYDLVEE